MKRAPPRYVGGLLACAALLAGCSLTPYDSGEVSCRPDGAPCPDGYGCLDPKRTGTSTCVWLGCGDGIIDPLRNELCDDVNNNDMDLCDADCRAYGYGAQTITLGGTDSRAEAAQLKRPLRVAADRDGNLYIAAILTNRIFRYDRVSQRVTEYAGNGGFFSRSGLNGLPPTDVATTFATSLHVDGAGAVFFGDIESSVVRRIDPVTGLIDIVAGTGEPRLTPPEQTPSTFEAAIATPLLWPRALTTDGQGNLYVAETLDSETGASMGAGRPVRRIDVTTGLTRVLEGFVLERSPLAIDVDGQRRLHALEPLHERGVRLHTMDLDGDVVTRRDLVGDHCGPAAADFTGRLEVTVDGDIFFLGDSGVVRVPRGAADCEPLDLSQLGGEPGSAPALLPGRIQDFALTEVEGRPTLAIADIGTGVIWELDLHEGTMVRRVGQPNVTDTIEQDMPGVINELAAAFDGRISVGVTDDCGAQDLSLQRLEFYGSLPDFHRAARITCAQTVLFIGSGDPGLSGDGGPAQRAQLRSPSTATSAADCQMYVADSGNDRIRRVRGDLRGDNTVETVLGGNADLRPLASLTRPFGVAPDPFGGLLVSDRGNNRILRLQLTESCSSDDECLAGETCSPAGCIGPDGCARSRDLEALLQEESLTLYMGGPDTVVPGSDGPVFPVTLVEPTSLVLVLLETVLPGAKGWMLFINERGAHRIRWIFDPLGNADPSTLPVRVLAGSEAGEPGDNDDENSALGARFRLPRTLMLGMPDLSTQTPKLTLLVTDAVERVREVRFDPLLGTSQVQTPLGADNASRHDGPLKTARLHAPSAMAHIDEHLLVFVEKSTGRLRLMRTAANAALGAAVTTAAGMPEGREPPLEGLGPPQPALELRPMRGPTALLLDLESDPVALYAAASGEGAIWRFHLHDVETPSTWTAEILDITFAAREGENPSNLHGDADAEAAMHPTLSGLALDAERRLYISDSAQHVIWRTPLDHDASAGAGRTATVFAGVYGERGFAGDASPNGDATPATRALFNAPSGLMVHEHSAADGAVLFVADTANNRVRRVQLDGERVTTVLGDGAPASGGVGFKPALFSVHAPAGVDVDRKGNLFVTSVSAVRLVQAGDNGVVDGDDPREEVATIYGRLAQKHQRSEDERFLEGVTRCLSDVQLLETTTDSAPVPYVLDTCLGAVLRLDRTAIDERVAAGAP